ncbi:hypothetical protein [Desulfosarcina variabilis]|uniref:hypothetical protein n=1 Tax=Desulfosarcina variabilis TaxID=2300 RepID=UPI003AFA08F5
MGSVICVPASAIDGTSRQIVKKSTDLTKFFFNTISILLLFIAIVTVSPNAYRNPSDNDASLSKFNAKRSITGEVKIGFNADLNRAF